MGSVRLWRLITLIFPLRLVAVIERARLIRTGHQDLQKAARKTADGTLPVLPRVVDAEGQAVIIDSEGKLREHAARHLDSGLHGMPLQRASSASIQGGTPLTRGVGTRRRQSAKRSRMSRHWQDALPNSALLVNDSAAFEEALERKMDDHVLLMLPDHLVGDFGRYLTQESSEAGSRQVPTLPPAAATTAPANAAAAPVAAAPGATTAAPMMTTGPAAAAAAPGAMPGQASTPQASQDAASSSSTFLVMCVVLFLVAAGGAVAVWYFKRKTSPAAGRLAGATDAGQDQVWKSSRSRGTYRKSVLSEKTGAQKMSDDSDEDDRAFGQNPLPEKQTDRISTVKAHRGSRAPSRGAASAPSGSENEKASSGGTGGSAYRDRRLNR